MNILFSMLKMRLQGKFFKQKRFQRLTVVVSFKIENNEIKNVVFDIGIILWTIIDMCMQYIVSWERGKVYGHKPHHFPHPCSNILLFCLPAAMSHNRTVFHATAFESSAIITCLNNKFSALKLWFSNFQRRHAKYMYKELYI